MEREELERIYEEHARCAFSLFLRFVKTESDARDLLQDWLVKIAQRPELLVGVTNERSFLLRIAYRQAVDWSRKLGVRRRTSEEFREQASLFHFAPESDPDRETFRQSLESSLHSLPIEQQMIVQLKLWDELTFSEIAEVLDIPANTAASRYRYGIEKLREMLRPVYEELES